eukprot:TRINITY_DN8957_c0_g4_i1.p1 TRINITY_DN8957_c0_g4~~TRINITY_DN8957_c0_g4_i1.p1  ORF type:complete len:179 (+),score=14.36 TRINITY_DN8957_c0_g4_i1:54-539(+)
MFFFIINTGNTSGEHDFFEIGEKTYCVAQPWLLLMWIIPICPMGPPRLMVDYQTCDRRVKYLSFKKETPSFAWLRTILYTYLRFLTLGLFCAIKLKASEKRKLEILRCAGVCNRQSNTASAPVQGIVQGIPVHEGAQKGIQDLEAPEEPEATERTRLYNDK